VGIGFVLCALALPSVAPAGTTTSTVGQNFPPDTGSCTGTVTALQTGVAGGNSYRIASDGIITSWSFQSGPAVVPNLKLKVGHASGGTFIIDAEATAGGQLPNQLNTYSANIPVKAGEVIGIGYGGGDCATNTGAAADTVIASGGDVGPGLSMASPTTVPAARLPVSAVVSTTTPDPSNVIAIGKPILKRSKGTAVLPVSVPGAGNLTLSGTGLVAQRPARASVARAVSAAGVVNLKVKPKGKAKKKLNKIGKAKVKATVTFTPTGGNANAQPVTVKLRKKLN